MLKNIVALVTIGLLALQVAANPVPGEDDYDKHDKRPKCKYGQIFDEKQHKCVCPDG
jgi:hypothetical protein